MSMDANSPDANAPNTQILTLGDTPTQAYLRPCSANTLNPAWQTCTELSEHFVSRRHWSRMRADVAQGRAFHPSVRSGRIHESDEDSRKPNPRLQGHRPVNLPSINETRSSVHHLRTFSTHPHKYLLASRSFACFCMNLTNPAALGSSTASRWLPESPDRAKSHGSPQRNFCGTSIRTTVRPCRESQNGADVSVGCRGKLHRLKQRRSSTRTSCVACSPCRCTLSGRVVLRSSLAPPNGSRPAPRPGSDRAARVGWQVAGRFL